MVRGFIQSCFGTFNRTYFVPSQKNWPFIPPGEMSREDICQLSGSCSCLVLVFLRENLSLFEYFFTQRHSVCKKLCFSMSPFMLGGHEENRLLNFLKFVLDNVF